MDGSGVTIRVADEADIPAIAAIYKPYVLQSTCTFAETPPSEDEWAVWFALHNNRYLALVAASDGEVVGWGSLSPWNTRCAYRFAVEDSVYVAASHHRRGVGEKLLAALIEAARAAGHHSIVAQIADDQAASERLHAKLGFKRAGRLHQIGYKFDRWVDVCIWQCVLGDCRVAGV